MAMPLLAARDDRAVEGTHRRKQCGRTVPLVVVGHGGSPARLQRQAGLRAIQCLNLTLLVAAQHQGVFWGIQVKTHDGFQFLGEARIVADLERLHQVRLQPMFAPDAAHRRLT